MCCAYGKRKGVGKNEKAKGKCVNSWWIWVMGIGDPCASFEIIST